MLDVIGWSTTPEDIPVLGKRIDQLFDMLLLAPWWLPWAFAFSATGLLMWSTGPRGSSIQGALDGSASRLTAATKPRGVHFICRMNEFHSIARVEKRENIAGSPVFLSVRQGSFGRLDVQEDRKHGVFLVVPFEERFHPSSIDIRLNEKFLKNGFLYSKTKSLFDKDRFQLLVSNRNMVIVRLPDLQEGDLLEVVVHSV